MPAYIEGMDACGLKWVNVHLAIQDVSVANLVYKTALKKKIGRWVAILA